MNQHRLRVRTPFHVIAGVQVDHVGSVITLQVKGQPDLRLGLVTASAVGELLLQAARDHSAGAPPMPENRAMWLERDLCSGAGWESMHLVAAGSRPGDQ